MTGRPSIYSQALSDEICEMISDGMSIREICRKDGMPGKTTIMRWLQENNTFRDQYAQAKEIGIEAIADDILDIADNGMNDWMERRGTEGENVGWQINGEAVRRSQIRIDARKWVLSKLAPKKYGDKISQEISGPDGGPVSVSRIELVALGGEK